MREAAYSVVATVPLGHNVEVLERKLIALRAEIDAILSLLASGTIAAPAPAIEVEPRLLALEAIAGEPSLAELTAQPEVAPEACLEADAVDRLEDDMPTHAIASNPQGDVAPLAGAVEQHSDIEVPASDPVAPIDALDRPQAVVDATSHAAPGTAETETIAHQAEMPVDLATATATPSNLAACVDAMPSQPTPPVAAAPERAVDDLPAPADRRPGDRPAAAPAQAQDGAGRRLGPGSSAAQARSQDRRLDHSPAHGGNGPDPRRGGGHRQRAVPALDVALAVAVRVLLALLRRQAGPRARHHHSRREPPQPQPSGCRGCTAGALSRGLAVRLVSQANGATSAVL